MLTLLWGLPGDSPLDAVYQALQDRGSPTVFLDQREIAKIEIYLSVGHSIAGEIITPQGIFDLDAIAGVYLRPYDSRRLPFIAKAGSESEIWQHATAVDEALLSWVEMTSALVLNRPSAMASNNSKPYQLQKIRQAGFLVPDTLVTTDPDAVYEFWKQHGSVIYKSISSTRSQVTRLSVEHHQRLAKVAWCPTQFQQYIPGQDYRVHVVGEAVFACAIASTADDYRYPNQTTDYPQLKHDVLPLEIEQQCRQLAATLKLPLAGIDLRQTSKGEWYCFEVNPSPGYTFYQQETNQPISFAIAQLLTQSSSHILAQLQT